MKINRKNGLRKMQVTDVIIPLLKGGWYHRVSPVKEKPHVLRGDIYLLPYLVVRALCGIFEKGISERNANRIEFDGR